MQMVNFFWKNFVSRRLTNGFDLLYSGCRLGHKEQKDEWIPRLVEVFTRGNILPPTAVISAGSAYSAATAGNFEHISLIKHIFALYLSFPPFTGLLLHYLCLCASACGCLTCTQFLVCLLPLWSLFNVSKMVQLNYSCW